jgi:hypothetical protein
MIDGRTSGLDDENIPTSHVVFDLAMHFPIWEIRDYHSACTALRFETSAVQVGI